MIRRYIFFFIAVFFATTSVACSVQNSDNSDDTQEGAIINIYLMEMESERENIEALGEHEGVKI